MFGDHAVTARQSVSVLHNNRADAVLCCKRFGVLTRLHEPWATASVIGGLRLVGVGRRHGQAVAGAQRLAVGDLCTDRPSWSSVDFAA